MASGTRTRASENPLKVSALGNEPKNRVGLSGIRTGQGSVDTTATRSITDGNEILLAGGAALKQKRENEEFLQGQMSAMSGETEQDIRDRGGSRQEMAGMVSIEVGNMLSEWHQNEVKDAQTNWSEATPEAYQKHLAKKSAGLIAAMGGDAYAQKQLAAGLAQATGQLAQAQQISHQGFVEDGVANAYGYGLNTQSTHTNTVNAATAYGPRTNVGYQDFAVGVVNKIVGAESGGDNNAQNERSTAGGAGQFIDSTWLDQLQKNRPDLVAKHTRVELLAMKTNGRLSREMTVGYARENASVLARAGLPINDTNAYLAHFAGAGGAIRLLTSDPSAHVSAALNAGQIASNPHLKDWTVGQVIAWAGRKMGAEGAGTSMKQRVLTNPGISPERHRAEVLGAMLDGLENGDASLYETSGGRATLIELGVSPAEARNVQRAYEAYKKDELDDYSLAYERGLADIIQQADDGKLDADTLYEMLEEFQAKHPRTDVEMRRAFNAINAELVENVDIKEAAAAKAEQDAIDDAEQAAKDAAKDAATLAKEAKTKAEKDAADKVKDDYMGWHNASGNAYLMGIEERMLAATTAEEVQSILQEVQDEGLLRGVKPKDTGTQIEQLMTARKSAQDKLDAKVKAALKKAEEKQKITDAAATAVGNKTLRDQSDEIQREGVKILKSKVLSEIMSDDSIADADKIGAATKAYAAALIDNQVFDEQLASQMAGAVVDIRGWADGAEMPEQAIVAYANYLEMVKGNHATEAYMNEMFEGKPEALAFFRTAVALDSGNADTEPALRAAARVLETPVTLAAVTEDVTEVKYGGHSVVGDAVEGFIRDAGLAGNWVQRRFGTLLTHQQQDADAEAMRNDPDLSKYLETVIKTQKVLTPNMNTDTAMKYAIGQANRHGAAVVGKFIVSPPNTTLYKMAGLPEAKGVSVINDAVSLAIVDAFKNQLPEESRKSVLFAHDTNSIMDRITKGMQVGDPNSMSINPNDINADNFTITTVNIDGDMVFRVRPNEATINRWPKWMTAWTGTGNVQDLDTLGMEMEFTLSDAGKLWRTKDRRTTMGDHTVNAIVDVGVAAAQAAGEVLNSGTLDPQMVKNLQDAFKGGIIPDPALAGQEVN